MKTESWRGKDDLNVHVVRAGTGGAPCADCGAVGALRLADPTGAICLTCLDKRLLPGDSDLIRVDFCCPRCGKDLRNLPLAIWRKLYEQHDLCLDCRRLGPG